MSFLETFTSRANLTSKLNVLWTDGQAALNMARQDIATAIGHQLREGVSAFQVKVLPPLLPMHNRLDPALTSLLIHMPLF